MKTMKAIHKSTGRVVDVEIKAYFEVITNN